MIGRLYLIAAAVRRRPKSLLIRRVFQSPGRGFGFCPDDTFSYSTIRVGDAVYIGPGAFLAAGKTTRTSGNKVECQLYPESQRTQMEDLRLHAEPERAQTMCGICGIIDHSGVSEDLGVVRVMVETLRHRGPDDSGVLSMGPAHLGQSRLSIIDLSPTGHQPMQSSDDSVMISYNGEVYNFPELRERLQSRGVSFRGSSDTEVVLQAYLAWGQESFEMLHGMFALSIWDQRTQELHLVRDRFGIKPLYYARTKNGIVFGSEIKAILRSGRVPAEMNTGMLHEYLYYGTVGGQNTLFSGIQELLPGHHLTLTKEGSSIRPYWSARDIAPCNDDIETATDKIRSYLDKSVARHLLSDVPVGLFLSGGIDSSAIAAIASKHYAGRLQAFTASFDFMKKGTEVPLAKRLAKELGMDHQEIHIRGADVQDVIEKLVQSHDEPFADAANIPLYLMCEQLKGQVKVILQGDGGDEVFAGYRRYNVLSHETFWRGMSPFALAAGKLQKKTAAQGRRMRFFEAMRESDPALRLAWLLTMEPKGYSPINVLGSAYRDEVCQHDPFIRYREAYADFQDHDAVQRALYTDMQVLLPDIFLEKVDKSTMAHSVEVRVPMLDAELVQYAMSLPSSMKVYRREKKWLLRRALRGTVPDYILDAPKKGFAVPYAHWLRTSLLDYMKSVLFDPMIQQAGLFDARELEVRIDDHVSGRRDNGFLLYKVLNLALWYHQYVAQPVDHPDGWRVDQSCRQQPRERHFTL